MPRGVPKAGFRNTKKRQQAGIATIYKQIPTAEPLPVSTETVEETEKKLTERFDALEKMSEATLRGTIRALIVSGPGGLGKSFTVEEKVKTLTANRRYRAEIISGFVRPTGMYKVLYDNRNSGSTVVFDDADSIFSDENSLNLLKKACDTTDRRILSWLAETNMEDSEGEKLPRTFEFNGNVIFITNMDFDTLIARGHKLAPHLEAMVSRSHYLDLAMKTRQDYMVRIKSISRKMLRNAGFNDAQHDEIIDYIDKNQDRMRELSLRMVLKIGDIMKMEPQKWRIYARATCMRNAA